MKILKNTPAKNGKCRVIVELDKDEYIVAIAPDSFYRLGEPMDEVMPSHVFEQLKPVSWCPVEQKWVHV